MGRVFDRQVGLIRGATRPTAPVHDGNFVANALCATVVGNRGEPSGESRLTPVGVDSGDATVNIGGVGHLNRQPSGVAVEHFSDGMVSGLRYLIS